MASVASRNIFDILGDSEDAETVKEKEPTTKEPPVVKKKVDRSRAHPQEKGIRFDYPQRGGHKGSASNRNEDTRSAAPRDRNVGPRLSGRNEEGGGGRGGDYPARSSRGARSNDRDRGGRGRGRRGREFDRHSGTGKYDSEKKEAQAWGKPTETWQNNNAGETPNWGAENNDNAAASSTWGDNGAGGGWANETATTEEKNEWGATEEKSGATEEKDAWGETADNDKDKWVQQPESDAWKEGDENTKPDWQEGVEEPKNEDIATGDSAPAPELEEIVKTLDEYRAEKAQQSIDIPLPEARKANEGVDDSQWKDAVPLEKDEDDFIFAGKEQSYRLKNKNKKSKNYLEIAQTFDRPGGGSSRGRGRGRGGRGGRGGGRDDRDGRNNYRDNYDDNNRDNRRRGGGGGGRGSHVNLDDQSAFPSLGS